jgi:hypothetical protein
MPHPASAVDNHDNARFLNEKNDPVAYKNAIAWVLLSGACTRPSAIAFKAQNSYS